MIIAEELEACCPIQVSVYPLKITFEGHVVLVDEDARELIPTRFG
jgi:hypothetical protein